MKTKLILLLAVFLVCVGQLAFAQESTAPSGTRISNSDGPPYDMHTKLLYTTTAGGATTQYICWARSFNVKTTVSIASVSNASPASFASPSDHGFESYTTPVIKISGGTGAWAAVNGTWTATITGTGTFTIPVNTTSFGAVTGTLVVTTNAPRTTLPEWAVLKTYIDTSGNTLYALWAVGGYSNVCSDRATLSYQ